jgi:hypothetical protein
MYVEDMYDVIIDSICHYPGTKKYLDMSMKLELQCLFLRRNDVKI